MTDEKAFLIEISGSDIDKETTASTTVNVEDESDTQWNELPTVVIGCSLFVIVLINVLLCFVWKKIKMRRNPQVKTYMYRVYPAS